MRSFVRSIILNTLSLTSKPSPFIHVLNGHFVEQEITTDSVRKFENFIQWLSDTYHYISPVEAVESIAKGRKVAEPHITLTFDDGFEECYTIMFPILEKYGYKAAFFINPDSISNQSIGYAEKFISERLRVRLKKKFMNWNMVNEMVRAGHIIGSHTCSHAELKGLPADELQRELMSSKDQIETSTGMPCKYFAFPFGTDEYFDAEAVKKVSEIYDFGFTSGKYTQYKYDGYSNLLSRRHFECNWSRGHIRYFTSTKRN